MIVSVSLVLPISPTTTVVLSRATSHDHDPSPTRYCRSLKMSEVLCKIQPVNRTYASHGVGSTEKSVDSRCRH